MALITDAAFTWSSPVALGSDEIWQVRNGRVYVSTSPGPEAGDGIELWETYAI